MKIRVLSRNPDDYLRETKRDIHRMPRNFDPELHPFEVGREYKRALNATKLERVFAKPFLGSLDGHKEGIQVISKHPTSLSTVLTGSYDGEVRLWNVASAKCIKTFQAHDGFVRGIAVNPSGNTAFTCSEDKTIKQWFIADCVTGLEPLSDTTSKPVTATFAPISVITSQQAFRGIDHHWTKNIFATCGDTVQIWDEDRTEPIRTFQWGVDAITSLRFNPVEHHLLGATASDRSLLIYDMRGAAPLRKILLKLRSNALCWSPQEAMLFTVANEDYNLYTFDLRNLKIPRAMYRDHVAAVMDVDYSPTGTEFVSAGWDKTIRIFPIDKNRSREVYHTKRMQRVLTVRWTGDNKYILSGSDEMNVRIWKARASEKISLLAPREKEAFNYGEKLKEKFAHHPEIRRISRHRHVPKAVYEAAKEHRIIRTSRKRKEANRRAHSKPGTVPFVSELKKHVLEENE